MKLEALGRNLPADPPAVHSAFFTLSIGSFRSGLEELCNDRGIGANVLAPVPDRFRLSHYGTGR